ncbi:hypothetical protein DQ04_01551010 [Trypanosoma grayi]|uniref:hypothetical protein n=1 Tax=Trypanosoma grayi TaxID=71804 RepID=UPI0004F41CB1|nr:hypothetical protein DQ04_01551010 [Trypanosoma grayi]KEG12646.1 hypothetical protein DQ04_01551010 [Trypanosoma grayi]
MLQYPLTGHGRTSIIVTVRPDSPNMLEGVCTLKSGLRAQKVEAQVTPSGYGNKVLDVKAKLQQVRRKNVTLGPPSTACCRWEAAMTTELDARVVEVNSRRRHALDHLKCVSEVEQKLG